MLHDSLYEKAASFYGAELQETLWHEEVGELMQALSKHKRKPTPKTFLNIVEEIADVLLMTEQLAWLYDIDLVDEMIEMKSKRLKNRIKKAEEAEVSNPSLFSPESSKFLSARDVKKRKA